MMYLTSRPLTAAFWLVLLVCAGVFVSPACAEEEAATVAEPADAAADKEADDAKDETKQLLKQLTIAMVSEVLDERTVVIRDTSAKPGKKIVHLRMSNVGAVPRGSLNDADYAEKVNAAKAALAKVADKQMIWYKAAPENLQAADGDVLIADLWTHEGRHLSTALKKDGHLEEKHEYESELGKDILTAAAEVEKKESYKKLEEALKESEKAKQDAAKAARAQQEQEEALDVEGFGFGGWMGVALFLVIVIGAATNFGRPSNKKVNLNRKKGPLEKFWMKLKGA